MELEDSILYSYSTTNKMHLFTQTIYSCKMLSMFRTFFLSIIRSSKVRIQQRYTSNICCYLLLSGMSSISSPVAAGSSSYMTYPVAVYTVLNS